MATSPKDIGLSTEKLEKAYCVLQGRVADGTIMGGAIQIGRSQAQLEPRVFGRRSIEYQDALVEADTIFLCASITKPIVATAVMLLVERGELALDDTVQSIVPEFEGPMKEKVVLRHLLTHTSGLPDQLLENRDLRSRHAPMEDFLQIIYKTPLLFRPGTNVSYQSSGFAVLGEIIKRTSGKSLRDFLKQEIFDPIGMIDTTLGADWSKKSRMGEQNIPQATFQYGEKGADSWNWNSKYWRELGAPWGGLLSTTNDLLKLLDMYLRRGTVDNRCLFNSRTIGLMISNQVDLMPSIPEDVRKANPWGLGWILQKYDSGFGDISSRRTFGHSGATGTVMWADPEADLACVILTNQPYEEVLASFNKISNLIASSLINHVD